MKKIIYFIFLITIFTITISACKSDNNTIETSSSVSNSNSASKEASSEASLSEESSDASSPEEESSTPVSSVFETPKLYINIAEERAHKSYYIQAKFKLVDPNGVYKTIETNKGEISIRGNSTSAGPKYPYNIKFESKTGLLGMPANKKWYLLANHYDKTLMRNRLSYEFARDIGMDYVTQNTYVDVYLNGKYVGNYLLTQAIGEGKDRVDINIKENEFLFEYEPRIGYKYENVHITPYFDIIFGFNDPEEPTYSQKEFVDVFFKNSESALLSGNFNDVKKYFDVNSFVDFYIVNEYFKEVDFQTSSTRFYIKGGKLFAGPVWDFDLSAGNCSSDYYHGYNNVYGSGNSYEGLYCHGIWFGTLFGYDEFRNLLRERYREIQPIIINLYEDNELGKNQIDLLMEQYGKSFNENYDRAGWLLTKPYQIYERQNPEKTYRENVEYLRDWLKNRNDWMNKNL